MELELRHTQGVDISGTSWLYLDKETKTIVGLPWGDIKSEKFQYHLIAKDSGGEMQEHGLEVNVIPSQLKPNNLFTLTIRDVYSKFANNLQVQISLYNRLRKVFGRSGNPIVAINSIAPGSVVIGFNLYDSPRPKVMDPCAAVKRYKSTAFTKDGKGNASFVDAMSPYRLTKVAFIPLGDCEDVLQPAEHEFLANHQADSVTTDGGPNIVSIIIGTVIGLAVLIALIVAVYCYKRRMQASHSVSKNNGTYIETGVPVVFEEELKGMNKSDTPETEPLMEDSKPMPPSYPQNDESTEATALNASHSESTDARYQPPTPPVSEHDDNDR